MKKKSAPKKTKKADKKYPNHVNELTYFLDHPDIKREECIGNGSAPGSLASKINWGGQGTASAPKSAPATPAASSKPSSLAEQINFGGKFKK